MPTSASPTASRPRSPTASSSPTRCPGRKPPHYEVVGRPVLRAYFETTRAEARAELGLPAGRVRARGVRRARRRAPHQRRLRRRLRRRRAGGRHRPARHRARATTSAWRAAVTRARRSATGCSRRAIASGRSWPPPTSRVSRAGGTVWELAAAGLPALLVPYPHATGDHQHANARHFSAAGGAVIVEDAALDGERCAPSSPTCGRSPGDSRRCARACARARGPMPPRRLRASSAPGAGPRVSAELHLLGIGGAGMSGIARVLRGHGRTVSGCDRSPAAVERAARRGHRRRRRPRPVASARRDGADRLDGRRRARARARGRAPAGPARAPSLRRAGRDRGRRATASASPAPTARRAPAR